MYSAKSAIMTAFVLGIFSASADAVLPPDQIVTYRVREVPTDPQSDVVFEVILHLKADSKTGSLVKWNVDEAEFMQYNSQGSVIVEWVESSPDPGTLDGLWLIEHADPEDPQPSEFDSPPLMTGTAITSDPNEADLVYELSGDTYTGTPQLFQGNVAALTFRFTLEGEEEPEEEGDDEPAEVDVGEEPG